MEWIGFVRNIYGKPPFWGKSPRFFLSSFPNRARCCAFFFRHLAPLQRLPHRLETQGSFWGSHGWPVFLGKRQIAAWKIQVIWSEQSSTLVASKPMRWIEVLIRHQVSTVDSLCVFFFATTWRLIFSSDSCKLARMGVSFREFTYRKQPIFWMVTKNGFPKFPMRFSDQTWQCNIPHL